MLWRLCLSAFQVESGFKGLRTSHIHGQGTMMATMRIAQLRRAWRPTFCLERLLCSTPAACGAHAVLEPSQPWETSPSQESSSMRYRDIARQGQVGPVLKPKAADLLHDPRLGKLFKILEQRKFAELQAAHEELREAHVDVQQMDVYQYSKLLTQCVTHVGPETALPVFELMVQVGVVPNVVPYTIVIRALMELADNQRYHWRGLKEVAQRESYASKAVELLREMRSKGVKPNELTYKPIMAWLPAKGREAQFQEFKEFMKEDGVAFNGVFKYYEIRLLLRVGDVKKAERLYLEVKDKDDTVASSLDGYFLSMFSKSDRVEELTDLLPKVLPYTNSTGTTSTAFQCLGKHGQHDMALECFSILKKKGVISETRVKLEVASAESLGGSKEQLSYAFTGYVLGYSKANKLDDAIRIRKVVEEQCEICAPSEVFNILIDGCCKLGQVDRGLDLVDEMQQRGLTLSPPTFNPFIRDFARWGMPDEAFEMKAAMTRLGVRPSVVTYSTLINACVKLGNMEKAYNLLGEMKEVGVQPNSHCFNPIIMGFGTQERLDRALAVPNEMQAVGVEPDVYTYCMLIFACSAVRNEEKAFELLEEMQKKGIQPTSAIYSALASVSAKCGNLERSIEMVKEIEHGGEKVEPAARSAILSGLSLAGRLHEALALYGDMKKEGSFPVAYAVGALLVAVGKAGDLDCMFAIFEDCRSRRLWLELSHQQQAEFLNIRCINVVLGCIRHNQLGRALEFLRRVKEENIADVGVLFDKIFLHISNGGRDENEMCWLDVEDGFAVVEAMRELGLRPSRMALEALLDGCAAMNDSDQARRVVAEMQREGLALNVFSQIRLFRAFVAAEDEDGALELLSQIQPFDLQDAHVQIILMQTLQPHCDAAQDSPEAAQAPETLPKVRQKVQELMESHPTRYRADD